MKPRQKQMLRYDKKQVRRKARKLLNCGNLRVSLMCEEIRRRRTDAPPDLSRYLLLDWFCHNTVAATSRPRSAYAPTSGHSDAFLTSFEWRQLRMSVIKERGARCECCGATPADGRTVINVDHIKPRKFFPALSLVRENLQVLCNVCNHGKGNWDQTDWRAAAPASVTSTPTTPVIPKPKAAVLYERFKPCSVPTRRSALADLARDLRPRLLKALKHEDDVAS
jgi:5-methylcytosine-specific restriction endonuclease McrA